MRRPTLANSLWARTSTRCCSTASTCAVSSRSTSGPGCGTRSCRARRWAASRGRTGPSPGVPIRAVVFDVGETLIDETRIWSDWADWLGVPRLTFLAVVGALIERGTDHRDPIRLFRPDIDFAAERERRQAAGRPDDATLDDLYPAAVPALQATLAAGHRVGIAANQPTRIEKLFTSLGLELDFVAASETWGVQKPDPAFFERIATELDLPPREVAYVGDRLDNDVAPAAAAGMAAIFIRRGPWGWIQAGRQDPPAAAATIENLGELPEVLARLGSSSD